MSHEEHEEAYQAIQLNRTVRNAGFYQKIEIARSLWVLISAALTGMVITCLWIGEVQHEMVYNRRAIQMLWKEVFHSDLP